MITESGGSGSVSGSHVYANGGIYTITITVTDDDSGSAVATSPAVIIGAGVNGGVLQVVGTDLADSVTVNMQDASTFKVHADFLDQPGNIKTFSATDVDEILVVLCDGNDHGVVSSGITIRATVDGGAGNDKLKGGGGPNILLGGDGDDLLVGGSNRDLIIGGFGGDRMVGKPEDDIMIGGVTAFEALDFQARDVALRAIMDEWTSERTYGQRRANLMGDTTNPEFGNRLNGNFFLKPDGTDTTVSDDGAKDVMTGSSGSDWFFANLTGGGVLDKITDLSDKEFADALDFIFAEV